MATRFKAGQSNSVILNPHVLHNLADPPLPNAVGTHRLFAQIPKLEVELGDQSWMKQIFRFDKKTTTGNNMFIVRCGTQTLEHDEAKNSF
jgi:hypothetical protein